MWYAMQVRSGSEEDIKVQCQSVVDNGSLCKCFIPYYEVLKRYKGGWHKESKILFPGYVFMVSDAVETLYYELKKVIGLTKIIGTGKDIVPLSQEEIAFLQEFGADHQIVRISEGLIENDRVVVVNGPLKGNERYIKRIDRHKRKAYLELKLFGRKIETQVGLEIIDKR